MFFKLWITLLMPCLIVWIFPPRRSAKLFIFLIFCCFKSVTFAFPVSNLLCKIFPVWCLRLPNFWIGELFVGSLTVILGLLWQRWITATATRKKMTAFFMVDFWSSLLGFLFETDLKNRGMNDRIMINCFEKWKSTWFY